MVRPSRAGADLGFTGPKQRGRGGAVGWVNGLLLTPTPSDLPPPL